MSLAPQQRMTLLAHAKINLSLEILARRPDGYHDLRSVMVPLALHDRVNLELRDSGVETVVENIGLMAEISAGALPNGKNLATRAALALQKETGCTKGAFIRIEKKIPVGGGLGGGSTDAAATLRGLNQLWETGLSDQALMTIGARMGCDIPALIASRAVLAVGRGDQVTPIDLGPGPVNSWWVTLINPGFSISTEEVYGAHPALTPEGKADRNIVLALKRGDVSLGGESLFNGLQDTVFRKYPLIKIIVQRLLEAGAAGALLCGSGSSVFALARTRQEASGLAEKAAEGLGSSVWTAITETLPDGVMVAHGPLEA